MTGGAWGGEGWRVEIAGQACAITVMVGPRVCVGSYREPHTACAWRLVPSRRCAAAADSPLTRSLRRGPLLLACMVVGALSAIFIVSCVDIWDAYEASRGKNGPLGAWAAMEAVAGASSSVTPPHVVLPLLPQALAVPLTLGGAGGPA